MSIKVTLQKISNNGPKQEAFAIRACEALEEALNHPDFNERVVNATYKETRFRDGSGRWFSVPAHEIPDYITSGIERGTTRDSEIDIKVYLKWFRSGILGSTTLGKLPFYTAFWFINGCIESDDYISLARHFIHEWLHVSGFYHYPNNKARKDVPYVVGDIVRDLLLFLGDKNVDDLVMEEAFLTSECGATETTNSIQDSVNESELQL